MSASNTLQTKSQVLFHPTDTNIATYNVKWVPNNMANRCLLCSQEFSFTRRRHHCRKCGQVFCDSCSNRRWPVIQGSKPVRMCELCYSEEKKRDEQRIDEQERDKLEKTLILDSNGMEYDKEGKLVRKHSFNASEPPEFLLSASVASAPPTSTNSNSSTLSSALSSARVSVSKKLFNRKLQDDFISSTEASTRQAEKIWNSEVRLNKNEVIKVHVPSMLLYLGLLKDLDSMDEEAIMRNVYIDVDERSTSKDVGTPAIVAHLINTASADSQVSSNSGNSTSIGENDPSSLSLPRPLNFSSRGSSKSDAADLGSFSGTPSIPLLYSGHLILSNFQLCFIPDHLLRPSATPRVLPEDSEWVRPLNCVLNVPYLMLARINSTAMEVRDIGLLELKSKDFRSLQILLTSLSNRVRVNWWKNILGCLEFYSAPSATDGFPGIFAFKYAKRRSTIAGTRKKIHKTPMKSLEAHLRMDTSGNTMLSLSSATTLTTPNKSEDPVPVILDSMQRGNMEINAFVTSNTSDSISSAILPDEIEDDAPDESGEFDAEIIASQSIAGDIPDAVPNRAPHDNHSLSPNLPISSPSSPSSKGSVGSSDDNAPPLSALPPTSSELNNDLSHPVVLKDLYSPVTEEDTDAENSSSTNSLNLPPVSPSPSFEQLSSIDGWDFYDPYAEYGRMGIPSKNWRISTVNLSYSFCPTYPNIFVVPRSINEVDLMSVAMFRSKQRLPCICWRDPAQDDAGPVLMRSAQPLTGIRNNRNEQDEYFMSCVVAANSRSSTLIIVDARPLANAMAQTAMGAGYESPSNYLSPALKHCHIEFLDIANIHVMHKSHKQLFNLVINTLRGVNAHPAVATSTSWWSEFFATDYFRQLASILRGASYVVRMLKSGHSVLMHCSDGWDRTAQVVALAQLCMDPYYRTLRGFLVLIEKEWLSFGHKFADRNGLGTIRFKGEESPVFFHWLDCVHQLWKQFPTHFEFNLTLLLRIADEVYAGRFGTFLFNSEYERVKMGLHARSVSLWTDIFRHYRDYINPLYTPRPSSQATSAGNKVDQKTLYIDIRSLCFWNEYFFRYDYIGASRVHECAHFSNLSHNKYEDPGVQLMRNLHNNWQKAEVEIVLNELVYKVCENALLEQLQLNS